MQYLRSLLLPMENKSEPTPLMHDLSGDKSPTYKKKLIAILLITAILGLGSGYLLSKTANKNSGSGLVNNLVNKAAIKKGESFGSDDTETYKDTTEGVLKEGGFEDEGQYHLVRPGGDSQNVYLTSSLVDLSKFIDRKIKVWGQTQKAQKAGWLMDVGRVEVQ